MKLDSTNILIIVAALVVAGGAYWYFFTGTGNQPPLSVSGGPSAAEAQFQSLVGELAPVTFDTTVLSDPRFMSLIDIATPITPESMGRLDPFAPIPGVKSSGG